jgi:hypothetical protein
LNPWKNAAENQAFWSLREAAARIGHELIHCGNSDDIDCCRPDFVLASASTQPKLNDVPHYGTIHEPRDRFLDTREYFFNLLTYDGYLTIADSLDRFLRDLCYGVGRPEEVGFYYNTCQRQQRRADLATIIRNRELIVTYFGTNWDHRKTSFFRLLSEADGVQICGPIHSWPDINPRAYGGAPSFDGESVQAKYATNGIGLCLLSEQHLRDDVISNRLFEIVSVGAIAICCELPWIRKYFGDSVYYIDQNLPDRFLVRAICQCRLEIYANPEAAIEKAFKARRIFEQSFAAEVLLVNAVDYHTRMMTSRQETLVSAKARYDPLISVIIRCGGRPVDLVKRALESLSGQTYGQFEVVFVRHRELDLTSLCNTAWANIRSINVVDCFGGNRSDTLWTGLNAVAGEYFSVLDDDDWLFSDHFERLFQPFPKAKQKAFFAYAGSISDYTSARSIMGGGIERRQLFRFGIQEEDELLGVAGAFASNCFVASTDLLHTGLLRSPRMSTAEDSYLILSLVAQVTPRFSYAATSLHQRGHEDQSEFSVHPQRFEDELALHMRLFRNPRPGASRDPWARLQRHWSARPLPHNDELQEDKDRVIYRVKGNPLSMFAGAVQSSFVAGYESKGSKFYGNSQAREPSVGSACVETPEAPWAYGAALVLRGARTTIGDCLVVAEARVESGEVGIGLLNVGETDFLFRRSLKADRRVQEVHIPIPDLKQAGRFIVQNWQEQGPSRIELLSIRVLS